MNQPFHSPGAQPGNPPRRGDQLPAVAALGWRYHTAAFETSPCGVQWMRYDEDAPYPEIIQTLPHVAFEVDDLDAALIGREILIAPNSPSQGARVAMILDHGAPIELIEFHRESKPRATTDLE